MSDVSRRVSQWKKKCTPERTASALEAIREDMTRRYEAAVVDLVTMEDKVRQVLNAAGVHTAVYVPYLNYARQLYRLTAQQHISGDSFALVAQVLLEKWAARGMRAEVLADIRQEVFNIEAPTP